MSLDKITQAVIDLKGSTTIPQDISLGGYRAPESGYETLCTTNDDDNGQYVWAANDSRNAENPNRRICTLDEYLAQCAKVKEFMNFYDYTFDQPFDVKLWNDWNEELPIKFETPKKKYWNGDGVPEVGEWILCYDIETEVEFVTKSGYFVLSGMYQSQPCVVHLKQIKPVKTKKDLVVESVCAKLFVGNSDITKSVVEQLYDLNLLKEID